MGHVGHAEGRGGRADDDAVGLLLRLPGVLPPHRIRCVVRPIQKRAGERGRHRVSSSSKLLNKNLAWGTASALFHESAQRCLRSGPPAAWWCTHTQLFKTLPEQLRISLLAGGGEGARSLPEIILC